MSANPSIDAVLKLPVGHPLRVAAERRIELERSGRPPPARAALDAAKARSTAPPRGAPWSRGKFSNARPTTCAMGHAHPSGLEARVCGSVHVEAKIDGLVVFQQARVPLFAGGVDPRGRPLYATPDFLLVRPGNPPSIVRAVDAKGRASPEWRRGAQMFFATYGVRIEERTK